MATNADQRKWRQIRIYTVSLYAAFSQMKGISLSQRLSSHSPSFVMTTQSWRPNSSFGSPGVHSVWETALLSLQTNLPSEVTSFSPIQVPHVASKESGEREKLVTSPVNALIPWITIDAKYSWSWFSGLTCSQPWLRAMYLPSPGLGLGFGPGCMG